MKLLGENRRPKETSERKKRLKDAIKMNKDKRKKREKRHKLLWVHLSSNFWFGKKVAKKVGQNVERERRTKKSVLAKKTFLLVLVERNDPMQGTLA